MRFGLHMCARRQTQKKGTYSLSHSLLHAQVIPLNDVSKNPERKKKVGFSQTTAWLVKR